MKQKNLVAIHDISCHGKCSLTVALPIISAAGITTNILPTAVLSTHTGGFTGYTYKDLTDQISPIQKHWESLNFKFDSIYTGFLGSFEQLELVGDFIDSFSNAENIVVIDPAMADDGKMYPVFDMEFAKGMAKLCTKGDIIVPNITEALFLLDKEFVEGPYTADFIERIILELAFTLDVENIVLTGTSLKDGSYGVTTYNRTENSINFCRTEKINGSYHGTGDIYASSLIAALLNNFSLFDAAKIAAEFTSKTILNTIDTIEPENLKSGMQFEAILPHLIKSLGLCDI